MTRLSSNGGWNAGWIWFASKSLSWAKSRSEPPLVDEGPPFSRSNLALALARTPLEGRAPSRPFSGRDAFPKRPTIIAGTTQRLSLHPVAGITDPSHPLTIAQRFSAGISDSARNPESRRDEMSGIDRSTAILAVRPTGVSPVLLVFSQWQARRPPATQPGRPCSEIPRQ
jgi:hypothetical protein